MQRRNHINSTLNIRSRIALNHRNHNFNCSRGNNFFASHVTGIRKIGNAVSLGISSVRHFTIFTLKYGLWWLNWLGFLTKGYLAH
ncbi:hypothetical protein D3C73_1268330 [compost metagenome]